MSPKNCLQNTEDLFGHTFFQGDGAPYTILGGDRPPPPPPVPAAMALESIQLLLQFNVCTNNALMIILDDDTRMTYTRMYVILVYVFLVY